MTRSTSIRIVPIAIIALLFASCGVDVKSITGSGNVITVKRSIAEDFNQIDVDSGIEVTVEQGEPREVMIEADDNVEPMIKTIVTGKTLKITSDYNNYINVTKKVKIRMPEIRSLSASGGSNLTSKNTLRSEDLELKASSGSDMSLSVEADDVSMDASSGAHLEVSGKALKAETSSSSGSTIDASKLFANDVKSQTSSGSSTDVNPILTLKAKASSGSSIEYNGNPKQIKKDESSGGSVSAK